MYHFTFSTYSSTVILLDSAVFNIIQAIVGKSYMISRTLPLAGIINLSEQILKFLINIPRTIGLNLHIVYPLLLCEACKKTRQNNFVHKVKCFIPRMLFEYDQVSVSSAVF